LFGGSGKAIGVTVLRCCPMLCT